MDDSDIYISLFVLVGSSDADRKYCSSWMIVTHISLCLSLWVTSDADRKYCSSWMIVTHISLCLSLWVAVMLIGNTAVHG